MTIHNPKLEREFQIYTVSGRPVFGAGQRRFSLDKQAHRLPSCCHGEETNSLYSQKRIAWATEQLGEQCFWRFVREVELIAVCF